MSVIDGPQAPISIVVGTCACTERTHCPEGGSLPVLVVMCEACEARHAAGVIVPQPLEELAELLATLLLLHHPLFLLFGWHSD